MPRGEKSKKKNVGAKPKKWENSRDRYGYMVLYIYETVIRVR